MAHVCLPLICVSLCFADSLQAQLISMGVIPVLVKLLGIHSHNTALTEMCLIAFGNLAELGGYNLQTNNDLRPALCIACVAVLAQKYAIVRLYFLKQRMLRFLPSSSAPSDFLPLQTRRSVVRNAAVDPEKDSHCPQKNNQSIGSYL